MHGRLDGLQSRSRRFGEDSLLSVHRPIARSLRPHYSLLMAVYYFRIIQNKFKRHASCWEHPDRSRMLFHLQNRHSGLTNCWYMQRCNSTWSHTADQGIICDRLLYKLQNYSGGSLFQSLQISLAVHSLWIKPLQQLWDDTINENVSVWTDAHSAMKSQFCRNAFRADSKGEQEEKCHEYTRQKIFESYPFIIIYRAQVSKLLWQKATPVIVGWLADRTWQNNSKWYT